MKDWGQIDDYNARFRGPIENPLLEGYKATSEIKQRQEQLEQQRAQNQLNTMKYLAEQQKASEIKGNVEAINANPADSAAVRRLAALDPAAAERVLAVNKIQNEQKGNVLQAYQTRKAADKPALYQQIRESILPSIGVDTSAWPTEYGDVANGIIEQELSKGRSTADTLDEEHKRLQNFETIERTKNIVIEQGLNKARTTEILNKSSIEKQPKPLSSEAAKNLSLVNSGLKSLNEFEKEITVRDKQGKVVTRHVPLSIGPEFLQTARVQKINTIRKEMSDILARLRTGAAINEAEIKLYKDLFPTPSDKDEVVKYKIEHFRQLFEELRNNLDPASIRPTRDQLLQELRGRGHKI